MEGEEEEPIPNTTNHHNAAVNRKHTAMLQRLSDRHTTSTNNRLSSDPPLESTQSFLSNFSQSKLSISSSISSASSKSEIDSISESISSLEKLLAESSYFLPSYELRTCLHTVSTLRQELDSVSGSIVPKKKFSFRNKKASNLSSVPELPPEETTRPEKPSFSIRESPGFRDKEDEVLSKEFQASEMSEFAISNLSSCVVRLRGCIRALYVHKLKNCRVYSGPVSGSVLIEEAEDCVFMLASHQIRIHHAKKCDFYLRVRSRPIIEDCSEVRFAPYCLSYEGIEKDLGELKLDEETENWANVDDFRWLKAVQSPNWSILPENERVDGVAISNLD